MRAITTLEIASAPSSNPCLPATRYSVSKTYSCGIYRLQYVSKHWGRLLGVAATEDWRFACQTAPRRPRDHRRRHHRTGFVPDTVSAAVTPFSAHAVGGLRGSCNSTPTSTAALFTIVLFDPPRRPVHAKCRRKTLRHRPPTDLEILPVRPTLSTVGRAGRRLEPFGSGIIALSGWEAPMVSKTSGVRSRLGKERA